MLDDLELDDLGEADEEPSYLASDLPAAPTATAATGMYHVSSMIARFNEASTLNPPTHLFLFIPTIPFFVYARA